MAFRGIEFALTGQPAVGDEFIVAPSSFQDMFSIVESLASAIEQPVYDDSSRTLVTNQVNAGILGIDQALTKTLDVRTQVGSRLAAIENQIDTNGAYELTYQETLASIEDLDYAEALSHLSLVATTLEAAQQSFVRTSNSRYSIISDWQRFFWERHVTFLKICTKDFGTAGGVLPCHRFACHELSSRFSSSNR